MNANLAVNSSQEKVDQSAKKNVLLGCTGSGASCHVPELLTSLKRLVNVKVVCTENSKYFFDIACLGVEVFSDKDEWTWSKLGDPILHIELRRWADLFLIAPPDANTLAKMASGLCDNLLTSVVRAWDRKRPVLFAPGMNTHMWEHPLTAKHLEELQGFGYRYIPTREKVLMCGDVGAGGMATVETIVQSTLSALDAESSD